MLIDKNEVLRYLGHTHQHVDDELSQLIDTCIEEFKKRAKPLYVYKILEVEAEENRVRFTDSPLVLEGNDIVRHLRNAGKCGLMAATLGADIDQYIRYLEVGQMTRALIMDACATAAIEGICDAAEEEIRAAARAEGLDINFRYSPGYGDLPLSVQPGILDVLNAQRAIGLTCTENYILLPRKSVTAVVGFIDPEKNMGPGDSTAGQETKGKGKSCAGCSKYQDCLYRRKAGTCNEH